MPVFRVQVHYRRALNEKWSNVWHVSATGLLEAADAFETTGVPDLLPILHNSASIDSLLVSDDASVDFITRPINGAGTSPYDDEMLPLFNSVKVLFNDGSFGRPDYKFFKGYLTEANTDGDTVSPLGVSAVELAMQGLIADMDAAGAPLVSEDNDPYATPSVQEAVQMRQMHRKRRKTATPPTP